MFNFLGVTENFPAIAGQPWTMRWAFQSDDPAQPVSLDGITFSGKVFIGETKDPVDLDIQKSDLPGEEHIITLACPGLIQGRWPYEVWAHSDTGESSRLVSGHIGVIASIDIAMSGAGEYTDRTLLIRLPGDKTRQLKLEWLATTLSASSAADAYNSALDARQSAQAAGASAEQSSLSAQTAASHASKSRESAVSAEGSATRASQSARDAADSAATAQESLSQAGQQAEASAKSAGDAARSATAAMQSEIKAATSAATAASDAASAEETHTKISTIAGRVQTDADNAAGYSQASALSADEAGQFASAAHTSAQTASDKAAESSQAAAQAKTSETLAAGYSASANDAMTAARQAQTIAEQEAARAIQRFVAGIATTLPYGEPMRMEINFNSATGTNTLNIWIPEGRPGSGGTGGVSLEDVDNRIASHNSDPSAHADQFALYITSQTASVTYATLAALETKMDSATANNTFATKTALALKMDTSTANNLFATRTDIADFATTTSLTGSIASHNSAGNAHADKFAHYLTLTGASSQYATIAALNLKMDVSVANNTFATRLDLESKLDTATANSTFATLSALSLKMDSETANNIFAPKTNPQFTGSITQDGKPLLQAKKYYYCGAVRGWVLDASSSLWQALPVATSWNIPLDNPLYTLAVKIHIRDTSSTTAAKNYGYWFLPGTWWDPDTTNTYGVVAEIMGRATPMAVVKSRGSLTAAYGAVTGIASYHTERLTSAYACLTVIELSVNAGFPLN